MIKPSFKLERKLIKSGYQNIIALDEVGRGALAGPLVAVAVQATYVKKLPIRDSKLLSAKQRESIFNELSQVVVWSAGLVSHQEIDRYGITKANLMVIDRALKKLKVKPDYLLLDKIHSFDHQLPFQTIVKGDQKVFSIALASILAKVVRDRLMRDFDQRYPAYGFASHKGYGTKDHLEAIKKHGLSEIHRWSYRFNLV